MKFIRKDFIMHYDPKLKVWEGTEAAKSFVVHDEMTPLVELPPEFNTLRDKGVRIFAKLMFENPLLNFKLYPAIEMLADAEEKGLLDDVQFLVEGSSGNTAAALAVLARIRYGKKLVAVVPRDIADGKLHMLHLFGAEVRFADPLKGGVAEARELGKQKNFLNLDQYSNEANIKGHAKQTAKQTLDQLGDRLSFFCAGLGTTATALGAQLYIKENGLKTSVIGVILDDEDRPAVPGVRTEKRLAEISFDWQSKMDYTVLANTKESYLWSLRLCRSGILGGSSSGFAFAGLKRFLETHEGELDKFRNRDGEVVAVFVCPDTALPYLDKYGTHLDPEDF